MNKGKKADLVLLNANPLEKPSHLNQLHAIIRQGKVYLANEILQETPEQVVQRQVNACNARNREDFLATYSDNIEVYNYPNRLTMKGKEIMRKGYGGMFKNLTKLHCKIVNRITLGNKVMDSESVVGFPGWEKMARQES